MRVALFVLSGIAACAQTFPVAGTVVDSESGTPVRRVRLVLGTRPPMTVVTGEDGKFTFDAPRRGNFRSMAKGSDGGSRSAADSARP